MHKDLLHLDVRIFVGKSQFKEPDHRGPQNGMGHPPGAKVVG